MSSVRVIFALVAGMLCLGVPVVAHHSTSTVYDVSKEKEVSLTGTVTKVEWANPHIHIYVDVKDANGKVQNFAVEGGTPNSLYRRGWRKDDVKPGDVVKIEGAAPSRNGSPRVHLGSITTVEGRQLFSGRD
jgi:DNA/RNA endonuclease YhcR with UshA esterase domain